MFEFLIDFARDNDLLIQGLDNEQLTVVAA
jgi:hypothetical protein